MKYEIFGESHGPAIGVVLTGVPAGLKLDKEFILAEMARRAPGQNSTSTARKESDLPELVSGVVDDVTTGAPLCAMIRNSDQHSSDYSEFKRKPRPSHSDFAAWVRYDGHNDIRGGGHFSGRLTAPLVFAGAVAKLYLKQKGIEVTSVIRNIGGVDHPTQEQMEEVILQARSENDSVGGIVGIQITDLPAGIGKILCAELRQVEGIVGLCIQMGGNFRRFKIRHSAIVIDQFAALVDGKHIETLQVFHNCKVCQIAGSNGTPVIQQEIAGCMEACYLYRLNGVGTHADCFPADVVDVAFFQQIIGMLVIGAEHAAVKVTG